MSRRTARNDPPPSYADWDPEIHDLPTASSDYFTYARKLRSEGYQWAFQTEMNSARPGGKVKIEWISHPVVECIEIRRSDCEEICRDQADLFGLKYVMIRQGPHVTRSVNINGRPTMVLNPYTKRLVRQQQPADRHMTVLMGHNIENLLIAGHIYLTWDGTERSTIHLMADPQNERKHLAEGEPAVAVQYWGVVRGDVPPLKQLQ
ncbi:uncharacterized protein B0T23DRAFT_394362 [Neurospora hispaniola]|uniref:Uncharacterized protein n=1 Tax=Neurospora hispaniola TaxID=588809 RepID=A0AAJ0I905_9PEZI|nr:hypothetical protein B0T23DRAFT_394362 [Neurospora hispaniola]